MKNAWLTGLETNLGRPSGQKESQVRIRKIAVTFGVLITALLLAMLAQHEYSNFRKFEKIQGAFLGQYKDLVKSRLNYFEAKVAGLQSLVQILDKEDNPIGNFHAHIRASSVWTDLPALAQLMIASRHNENSASASASPADSDERLRINPAPLPDDYPVSALMVTWDSFASTPSPTLEYALPLARSPDEPLEPGSYLMVDLNAQGLQQMLDLVEDTTKFAARLTFVDAVGQQMVLTTAGFSQAEQHAVLSSFPVAKRQVSQLGGNWTYELRPTVDSLVVAGFNSRALVLKVAVCFLSGFMAWLLLLFSLNRLLVNQRLKLLDKLEEANIELLEQSRKLEASRKNSEDFIGILGHEIRNPLTTMKYIHSELESFELPEEARRLVAIQQTALGTALDTLNNTLDLKKMELSALQLEMIEFEPLLIIQEIQGLIAVQCRNKRIALNINLDSSIPARIKGDPLRLKQVLLNLLNNAVKFTDTGGLIELAVSTVARDAGCVSLRFRVADSGKGIKPSMIAKLLEPYTQADSSIAREYGGTGLGLNIASRIIRLMGGALQINSKLGVGSEFRFDLQFQVEAPGLHQSGKGMDTDRGRRLNALQQQFASDAQKLKILYVDDSDFNLMIADELLKKSGHQLFTFSNPEDALQFLKVSSVPVDIVLSDLNMPGVNGAQFARQVRELPALKHCFIAALTASSEEAQLDKAAEDFDCILPKPFNPVQIINRFEEFKTGAQVLSLLRTQSKHDTPRGRDAKIIDY